jgi:uncharacterized phiE125 gp8 family phage protein
MKPSIEFLTEVEPFVTLKEAREQVVVQPGDDDKFLARLIRAARESVERDSGWALGERRVRVRWRSSPVKQGTISLPIEFHPLLSVQAVQYRDPSGELATFTGYQVDKGVRPAQLVIQPGQSWPEPTPGYIDCYSVTFVCGLSGESTTQGVELAKQACLMLLGHWYENRETVLVGSISKEIERSYNDFIESLRLYRYVG